MNHYANELERRLNEINKSNLGLIRLIKTFWEIAKPLCLTDRVLLSAAKEKDLDLGRRVYYQQALVIKYAGYGVILKRIIESVAQYYF